MALQKISDIILLIFVSISVPIYIVFIATLLINHTKGPLQSAFFTVCISLGVADIIMVFHSYLFVRSANWGWFESFWLTYGSSGSLLALISNALMFGMAFNQHLGVLLMAFNRFTAVVFSIKYKKIWSTRNTTIAIALQWILPVIIVAPMSFSKFEYDYYVKNGEVNNHSISVKYCDENYEAAYYIFSFIFNMTVNAATCAMYIAVIIGAIRHASRSASISNHSPTTSVRINNRSRISARSEPTGILQRNFTIFQAYSGAVRSQTAQHRRELRLAASGFIVFISMFMYFLFVVLVLITGDADFDDGVMYSIVCDIFSCINPYALLMMSKQTRVAFMRTLHCKRSFS